MNTTIKEFSYAAFQTFFYIRGCKCIHLEAKYIYLATSRAPSIDLELLKDQSNGKNMVNGLDHKTFLLLLLFKTVRPEIIKYVYQLSRPRNLATVAILHLLVLSFEDCSKSE